MGPHRQRAQYRRQGADRRFDAHVGQPRGRARAHQGAVQGECTARRAGERHAGRPDRERPVGAPSQGSGWRRQELRGIPRRHGQGPHSARPHGQGRGVRAHGLLPLLRCRLVHHRRGGQRRRRRFAGRLMQDLGVLVAGWLSRFEEALSRRESAALRGLFQADSHWRDVLALTWRIDTVSGASAIADALVAAAGTKASGFAIDERRAPPREVMRAGSDAVEAIFKFETEQGRGSGVVRLIDGKAWTLLTSLEELKGYEEHVGRTRPTGEAYSRDFRGPNWLDKRQAAEAYVDRDPEVIVVGGGHAGLSIAARLAQLDVDTLIVDREERIGDNWRKRYHALVLHNQVHVNHLPYMPFPATWPAYIPKDKLAGWFEAYVESLELNFWTSTEFEGGSYDDRTGRWTVKLRRNGEVRTMRPRHIVLATGVSGIPSIPAIPMLEAFKGTVVHSSRYESSEPWRGKKAIVIGTGNSGHDIAQDLYSGGAQVALVQRSPTLIVNVEPSAQLPYALYDEGPSLEDCDLITVATPLALGRKSHQILTEQARQIDKPLLDGLERIGFRLDFGENGTGWQFKYLD